MNKKIFLIIDGILILLVGLIDFLVMSGFLLFSKKEFTSLQIIIALGMITIAALFIFWGVMLIKANKIAGILAAIFFIPGIFIGLLMYLLLSKFAMLLVPIFYLILTIFLVLGWKELR